MITIIQGESFPIRIALKNGQGVLKPANVADLMICLGSVTKKYSKNEVTYKEISERWEFFPSQEETATMPMGYHTLWCTVKYQNGTIRKIAGETILIQEGCCGVTI